MRLADFDSLTFDCYGTLIDWETGLAQAIGPWLDRRGLKKTHDEVLETFAVCQSAQEDEPPTMLYSEVVARTLERMARAWGVQATPAEARAFGAAVGDWPAFADSPAALRHLKRHYRLAVLSNVHRASLAPSNATPRGISWASPSRPTGISGRIFESSTSFGTAITISVAM